MTLVPTFLVLVPPRGADGVPNHESPKTGKVRASTFDGGRNFGFAIEFEFSSMLLCRRWCSGAILKLKPVETFLLHST